LVRQQQLEVEAWHFAEECECDVGRVAWGGEGRVRVPIRKDSLSLLYKTV